MRFKNEMKMWLFLKFEGLEFMYKWMNYHIVFFGRKLRTVQG